jgi:glycolate oxidase iron-sulfur subunit
MQTNFTAEQLSDPDVAASEAILRRCVHCGFCTATCPTYVLLGDELDSPRGRIYLIKDMLENDRPASAQVVKHIDRCLSCLACMTTCPSDVHYMHLVDHARRRIEETYTRPLPDRLLRSTLATVLPRPFLFRLALLGACLGRPAARWLPGRVKAMLGLAPASIPSPSPVDRPQVFAAEGVRRARVGLLSGCAQQVLAPEINEATIRLLSRHGVEVVIAKGAGCCGALTHHMGKERPALRAARANIDAWWRELEGAGLDAVVINASGCGTTVKDYGFMLREDPAYAAKAARISAITRDVTELMTEIDLKPAVRDADLVVAYHSACSMQHGQQIRLEPKQLLSQAGFTVKDVPEGHLCCGSAGTYNLLQPAIATRLRDRKVKNIERVRPDLIATGNIGCITQIAAATRIPIVHTAALLDWATGGPVPKPLEPLLAARPADAPAVMPEAAD